MFDTAHLVAELCWGRWFQLHQVSIPLARASSSTRGKGFSFCLVRWNVQGDDRPSVMATRTSRIDCWIDTHLRTYTYTSIDAMNGESKDKESIFPRCELGSTVLSCFRRCFYMFSINFYTTLLGYLGCMLDCLLRKEWRVICDSASIKLSLGSWFCSTTDPMRLNLFEVSETGKRTSLTSLKNHRSCSHATTYPYRPGISTLETWRHVFSIRSATLYK